MMDARRGARRGRRSRGFTIVEIAVVTVMLGIVAALAVPTYGSVIERSRGESAELAARAYGTDVLKYVAIQRQVDPSATAATYPQAWVDAGKRLPTGAGITLDGVPAPLPSSATAADLNGDTAGTIALTVADGVVFAQEISGVNYQVLMSAAGDTIEFSPAAASAPGTLPTAPRTLTATASMGATAQVALTWQAPLTGSPIDYRVEYATASTGPWVRANDPVSTALSATVTNLTAGTPYWFRVAAVSTVGAGPWVTVGPVMAVTTPPTPKLACATGNTELRCSWSNPGSPGLVSQWRVYRDGTLVETTTDFSYVFTGLVNYTAYTIGVEAVNIAGVASTRATVTATPGLVAPPALAASSGASGITITWDAVSGATGYAVYQATSATAPQAAWTTVDPGVAGTSLTISSGLLSGTTYYFWVRALKSTAPTGQSSIAGPVSATTLAAPAVPTSVFCDPESTEAYCAWTAPSSPSRPVTSYNVYIYPALSAPPASPTNPSPLTVPSFQFTGLTAEEQYVVEVEAIGPGGTSLRAVSSPFFTLAP